MKKNSLKRNLFFTLLSLGLVFGTMVIVLAASGTTDSPAAPGSTSSYTLADIYQRLVSGITGSQSTFTEPSSAPGGTMHTLDDIMAAAPAQDGSAATRADVAAGTTFWGLSSGEWGLQTGTASRFTDHGDGTVTDNQTGLMWLKDASCLGLNGWLIYVNGPDNTLSQFNSGVEFNCTDYTAGTYTDWNLPQLWELGSLMDFRESDPVLPPGHPFTRVRTGTNSRYWTHTDYMDDGQNIVYLCFMSTGHCISDVAAGEYPKYGAWLVREP